MAEQRCMYMLPILRSKSKHFQKPLQGLSHCYSYTCKDIIKYISFISCTCFFCPYNESQWTPMVFGSQISSQFLFMFHRRKSQTGLEPHKGEKMTIFIFGWSIPFTAEQSVVSRQSIHTECVIHGCLFLKSLYIKDQYMHLPRLKHVGPALCVHQAA